MAGTVQRRGGQAAWRSSNRSQPAGAWPAVWVPTVTYRDVELTSRRLRNYQYNPVWGFLADQSWLP